MDGCCESKNAWDDSVRIDSSNTWHQSCKMGRSWARPLDKLMVVLDKKIEYMENELSTMGFKNVVNKWLKT
jgi:hypothetical protein